MIYSDLIDEIALMLGVESEDLDEEAEKLIKKLINDVIQEFLWLDEWKKTLVSEALTLDGSGEYLLDDTNLTNRLETLRVVVDDSGNKYYKYNYENYLALTDKSYSYAIYGEKIYIEGTSGTVNLLFSTPGFFTQYPIPLTGTTYNSFEPPPIKYYATIIIQMCAVSYYETVKDEESLQREQAKLSRMLNELKRKESRAESMGHFKMVRR
jgi:hypothetical protein